MKALFILPHMCQEFDIQPQYHEVVGSNLIVLSGFVYHQGMSTSRTLTNSLAVNYFPRRLLYDERFFPALNDHLDNLLACNADADMKARLGDSIKSVLDFMPHMTLCEILTEVVKDESEVYVHDVSIKDSAAKLKARMHDKEIVAMYEEYKKKSGGSAVCKETH